MNILWRMSELHDDFNELYIKKECQQISGP